MADTAKKIKQDNLVVLPQNELIIRVKEAAHARGITHRALAAKIGISQTALSQWFSGTYKGSEANLEKKAKQWLATDKERSKGSEKVAPLPNYVATKTAQRILSTLAFAQATHELVIAYGGAGMGKTQAAKEYARKHSNAWLTTITPASSAMLSVLDRIAFAIGVKPSSRRCAVVEAEILERLKDTDGLLIIDEAQHLKARVMEQIRAIFDASNIGLALLGNDIIYSQLTGGFRSASFAQMFSRISKRLHLRHPSESDVAALSKAMGVSGSSEKSLLEKIAARPGALRGVVQTVRLASILAGSTDIKATHLKQAWHELTETHI